MPNVICKNILRFKKNLFSLKSMCLNTDRQWYSVKLNAQLI